MGTSGLAEAYHERTGMADMDYQAVANLHHQVCRLLNVSDEMAGTHRLNRQQFVLMLAIKGLSSEERPTITTLAKKLCLRHHSVVELLNRLAARGAAVRGTSGREKREVIVSLTPLGDEIIQESTELYLKQLKAVCPDLGLSLMRV